MVSLEGILACSTDTAQDLPLLGDVIYSLRKCRESKDLVLANHTHKLIYSHGLESYCVLGNYLVPAYVECGNVAKAKQVFHKLFERSEHSWTSLLQGHVERGEYGRAIFMFEQMQIDCIQPSKFTLDLVLRAYTSLGYIGQAKEVHLQITKTGLDTDSFIGFSLADMYSKRGLLLDAQAVFLKMPDQNESIWSSLISSYCGKGLIDDIMHCLKQMQYVGVAPDITLLVHALKLCIETGSFAEGQELYAEIVNEELEGDLLIGNLLIDLYVKSILLEDAEAVLHELPNRDVVSWTTIMTGYVEQGLAAETLDCWDQMVSDSIAPNDVTYICMLRLCSSIGDRHRGQEIHAEIAIDGFENYLSVCSSLIAMYGKCRLLDEAQQVFEDCPDQDVISWNVLISVHSDNGYVDKAFGFFAEMQKVGISPNYATFSSLLKGCCSKGCLDKGRALYGDLVIEGLETHSFLCCSLVDLFAKCGSLAEAEDIFHDLPERNVVTWTALISGYVESDLARDALRCMAQMHMEGIQPNVATYVCALRCCSALEYVEKGHEFHIDIVKLGLEGQPQIGCSLVDMYAKSALVAEAQNVFNALSNRDSALWNALLTLHVDHGDTDEALQVLERMLTEDVSPDAGTYSSSLKACTKKGDIVKGRTFHSEIVKHGFEASSFAGNTVLDLYCKCGAFADAQAVFQQLSTCDVISWNTLMVGYYEYNQFTEVLQCLKQMQHNLMYADLLTFVYSLKACGSAEDTDKGQQLHAMLVKMGLEDDSSVSINLVDMYASVGFLEEAHDVFHSTSFQDATSWNVLIRGFVEQLSGEKALQVLEQMQSEGIHPNAVTFISGLKACCIAEDIDIGKEMHAMIIKDGLDDDPLIVKALVELYWKCGCCLEAHQVFDLVLSPDVGLWNAMLAGYMQQCYGERVFMLFDNIESVGMSPDALSYNYILKASADLSALVHGQTLHLAITKKGFDSNASIENNLLEMYICCGCLAEADEILDQALPDIVSWEGLISIYARHGLDEKVIKVLDISLLEGYVSPFMFVCGIKACGNLEARSHVQRLHAEIVKETFDSDIRVSNILVHMYAKLGLLLEAEEVFNSMTVQDVVAWTSLIAGFVENDLAFKALSCLEQMRSCSVLPNTFTYACSLRAIGSLGDLGWGQKVHSDIVNDGFENDQYVCSALVDMYAKCGSLAEAQDVYEDRASENVVLWNVVITGLLEQGASEGVLDYLDRMLLEGVPPDAVTHVCSLKSCSSLGAINKGFQLHTDIAMDGFELNTFVGNTLVYMYAKCGALAEAQEVFDEISLKNTEAWTALIAGYTAQGQNEVAFSLFERMIQTGLQPDGVSLLSVLSACSHTGSVEEALTYFNAFGSYMGIRLTIDHYNCLVDSLSRAGQLKECLYVIATMPFEPNFVTWSTMMGACRKWGDVKLGERAFECMMQSGNMQIGACTLMYNIYADAGMWEDAMRVDAIRANVQAQS